MSFCLTLQIEYLANLFRTPCYIEGVGRYEEAFDCQVVVNACSWLVRAICKNYQSIQNKIRFLRVVTQNESLSSNEEIPRKNRRPATGKRKVSVEIKHEFFYAKLFLNQLSTRSYFQLKILHVIDC